MNGSHSAGRLLAVILFFPTFCYIHKNSRVFCLTVCSVAQSCPYVMEEAIWFNFIKELGDLQRSRIDYV